MHFSLHTRNPHCPHRSYALADAKTRDRQAAILLFFSATLMVVGAVGALGDLQYDSLKRLWGFTSNGGWVAAGEPAVTRGRWRVCALQAVQLSRGLGWQRSQAQQTLACTRRPCLEPTTLHTSLSCCALVW